MLKGRKKRTVFNRKTICPLRSLILIERSSSSLFFQGNRKSNFRFARKKLNLNETIPANQELLRNQLQNQLKMKKQLMKQYLLVHLALLIFLPLSGNQYKAKTLKNILILFDPLIRIRERSIRRVGECKGGEFKDFGGNFVVSVVILDQNPEIYDPIFTGKDKKLDVCFSCHSFFDFPK